MPVAGPNRPIMLALASRPQGVDSVELSAATGESRKRMSTWLCGAYNNDFGVKLYRAQSFGVSSRYFTDEAHCNAWAETAKAGEAQRLQEAKDRKRDQKRAKDRRRMARKRANTVVKQKPAAMPAPVVIAERPAVQAKEVDYSRAKLTICPSPGFGMGGRYAVAPGHVGPFSLAGIGRDVQTGRVWE